LENHLLDSVISTFEELFPDVRLIGGFSEPEYLPPTPGRSAEIHFTRDYVRSALHEIAHWCVAGAERRKLSDFGYWYAPDGRTNALQSEFYRVEVRPQAIELILSEALGIEFEVSADNLGNPQSDTRPFQAAVDAEVSKLRDTGLPPRVRLLVEGFTKLRERTPRSGGAEAFESNPIRAY
jgi:elongation factor P hydroxylase